MDTYIPYPDLDEENPIEFGKNLYNKKEFYQYKSKKENRPVAEVQRDVCRPNKYDIQPYQIIPTVFLTGNTGYNSLLLFYGVGTGKTCTALQVAHEMTDTIQRTGGSIYILTKKIIKNVFMNEIIGYDRPMCLGDAYMDDYDREAIQKSIVDRETITKEVESTVSKTYKFFGYEEFANRVLGFIRKNQDKSHVDDKTLKSGAKGIIKNINNSVIIVDEAHNLVESDNPGDHRAYEALMHILQKSKNTKLILLSATPMVNDPVELVSHLNLMLVNDKRKKYDVETSSEMTRVGNRNVKVRVQKVLEGDTRLNPNDIIQFRKNEAGRDILTEYSKNQIIKWTTGYISHVRGKNPYTFPRQINEGNVIPGVLHYTKVIQCYMSKYQMDVYLTAVKKDMAISEEDQNERVEDQNKRIEGTGEGLRTNSRSASNMVYPETGGKNFYGKDGFENYFVIDQTLKRMEIKRNTVHKPSIFLKFDDNPDYDNPTEALYKYSCKYNKLIENINSLKEGNGGPIFIYVKDVTIGGVSLMSFILKANGYTRDLSSDKHKGKKFVILHGNSTEKERIETIGRFSSAGPPSIYPDNRDGSQLKILVASDISGEGISLMYCRQIHLMDAGWNMAKVDQREGRGVRHCSHKELPVDDQEVSIFKYVADIHPDNREYFKERMDELYRQKGQVDNRKYTSTDIDIYRIAETKDLRIKQVERIGKMNAIDCALNKNINMFDTEKEQYKNTRLCDYQDCEYQCISYPDGPPLRKPTDLDTSTYDPKFNKDEVKQAKEYIKQLYLMKDVWTLNQIVKELFDEVYDAKIEDLRNFLYDINLTDRDMELIKQGVIMFIYIALEEIIENEDIMINKNNLQGYIIYRGEYYIFNRMDLPTDTLMLDREYVPEVPIKKTVKEFLDDSRFVKSVGLKKKKIIKIMPNTEKIITFAAALNLLKTNTKNIGDVLAVMNRLKESDRVNKIFEPILAKSIIETNGLRHHIDSNIENIDKNILTLVLSAYETEIQLCSIIYKTLPGGKPPAKSDDAFFSHKLHKDKIRYYDHDKGLWIDGACENTASLFSVGLNIDNMAIKKITDLPVKKLVITAPVMKKTIVVKPTVNLKKEYPDEYNSYLQSIINPDNDMCSGYRGYMENGEFKIITPGEIRTTKNKDVDKRSINRGTGCETSSRKFKAEILMNIAKELGAIEQTDNTNYGKPALCSKIKEVLEDNGCMLPGKPDIETLAKDLKELL